MLCSWISLGWVWHCFAQLVVVVSIGAVSLLFQLLAACEGCCWLGAACLHLLVVGWALLGFIWFQWFAAALAFGCNASAVFCYPFSFPRRVFSDSSLCTACCCFCLSSMLLHLLLCFLLCAPRFLVSASVRLLQVCICSWDTAVGQLQLGTWASVRLPALLDFRVGFVIKFLQSLSFYYYLVACRSCLVWLSLSLVFCCFLFGWLAVCVVDTLWVLKFCCCDVLFGCCLHFAFLVKCFCPRNFLLFVHFVGLGLVFAIHPLFLLCC